MDACLHAARAASHFCTCHAANLDQPYGAVVSAVSQLKCPDQKPATPGDLAARNWEAAA